MGQLLRKNVNVAIPTREEIRTACLRIRRGWTESERMRRRVGWAKGRLWKLPLVPFDESILSNDTADESEE